MDAELRTILKSLQDGQQELMAGLRTLTAKVEEHSTLIKSLREGQEIIVAEMRAMEKRLDDKIDAVRDELHAKIDAVHGKLDAEIKSIRDELSLKMDVKFVITEVKFQEVEKGQEFLRDKVVEHEQALFFLKKNA